MKRAAVILGILTLGITSVAVRAQAQSNGKPAQQNPPAAGQTAPAAAGQTAPAPGTTPDATAPAGKRPPQAKTQPEFDAWKAAAANTDAAALVKASADFATQITDTH